MKKKKSGGGGANWMDTYGDMVTLLLCFFVLLYSMSTISEEKFKALVMSFNPRAQTQITATPGGEGPNADDDSEGGVMAVPAPEEIQETIEQEMTQLYQQLVQYAKEEGLSDSIAVTRDEDGRIYVSFNQTAFFDGNSAVLREDGKEILDRVNEMLSQAANSLDEVRIQGHTAREVANKANDPTVDRTLSANRATNVLIYIQLHSEVPPECLISEAYGEWHPVDTNETAEGRAQNRRVEMIISGRDVEGELADGMTQFSTVSTTNDE